MRKILNIALLSSVIAVSGCGLDNYDAPESKIVGRVVYNGQPVGVRGTGEAVQLQIFQDGYELRNPIPVYVTQDGSFEVMLFDGEYKLVTRNNNGPWVNTRDTTVINVRGTANVDVEVTPLFSLSNVSLSLSGSNVNAAFQINQVAPDWNIENAMILVGRTSFVDDVSYTARIELKDLEVGVPLTHQLDLSNNGDFNKGEPLYGRVSVRAAGKDQAIYSQVVKIR